MVSVDLSLNGSKFSLCNIYVPHDQRKQQEFLQDLSACLMSNTDTERLAHCRGRLEHHLAAN